MIRSTSATSSVVVDASVLVDAFLVGVRPAASRVMDAHLHAPVTIDAEFLHAMRRRWLTKIVDDEHAQSALSIFRRTPITRYPIEPLVPRMWFLRQNITAYDASYVALAESLDLPLITRDARLARSTGHAARIEYIA
ncbi:MAG TPA: type II toxin-antitoxin system VapC family toxin [Thermoanaerobaculia bacterium]|nr:type II toxin-antitoxin system VapC family toxin [Thermoanaerobaculia bacterium]